MKYAWIDSHRDQFGVARMCRHLGVSRTGYCQWRTRPPSPSPSSQVNAALDAQVAALHVQYKRRYGRPRILRELGQPDGHERVHQLRYDMRAQSRLDIVNWIEGFYNRQRLHSAINYQIPVAEESGLMAA